MSALALCRFLLRLARVTVWASLIVVIASALLYQLLGSPLLHILYKPLPHAGEASVYVPGKSFLVRCAVIDACLLSQDRRSFRLEARSGSPTKALPFCEMNRLV
jgi:hypothetical protein